MPIQIRCPNPPCGKLLQLPDGLKARRIKCPSCGAKFAIEASTTSFVWEEGTGAGALDETLGVPRSVGDPARTEVEDEAEAGADPGSSPTVDWSSGRDRGRSAASTAGWSPDAGGRTRSAMGEGEGEEDGGGVYDLDHSRAESGLPPRIGRFVPRRTLGAGAFGTVYLAFDTQLEREVALKVPRPSAREAGGRASQVLGEARAAARLRHPGIVQIHEVGSADGHDYIASAFVDGRTLAEEIAAGAIGPDDPARIARVARNLADALAFAHDQGIVHRDVKPSNVLLDSRGRPHLTDFGLAVRPEDTSRGGVAGTPAYMSPEQARGEEARPASDQYALGVVLYELLCGRPPFSGPVPLVLHNVEHLEPEPPRAIRPGVHPELEAICLRAMAKAPVGRFPDCRALAEALRGWLRRHGGSKGHDRDRFVRLIERVPVLGRGSSGWVRWAVGALVVVPVVVGLAAMAVVAYDSVLDVIGQDGPRVVSSPAVDSDRRPSWATRAPGPIADGTFFPDGRHLVGAGASGVGLWHREDGGRIDWQPAERSSLRSVAVSDDGRWMAFGDDEGVLVVRDAQTGRDRHRIAAHAAPISRVAFSPDGSLVASSSWDHTAKLWDLNTGGERAALREHSHAVWSVAFSPDGRRVATCGDDRALVWDASSGELLRELEGHNWTVTGVAFSPDGRRLATSSLDKTVRLWDPGSGRVRVELQGPGRPLHDVAWSSDGLTLASCEGDDPQGKTPAARPAAVWLWEADGGKSLPTLRADQGSIGRLAFSPDGDALVSFGHDGTIDCWAVGGGPAR